MASRSGQGALNLKQLPLPTTIEDTDKLLHSQLVEAAARQMAPCKYLGLQIAAGRFEPAPSQWRVGATTLLVGSTAQMCALNGST